MDKANLKFLKKQGVKTEEVDSLANKLLNHLKKTDIPLNDYITTRIDTDSAYPISLSQWAVYSVRLCYIDPYNPSQNKNVPRDIIKRLESIGWDDRQFLGVGQVWRDDYDSLRDGRTDLRRFMNDYIPESIVYTIKEPIAVEVKKGFPEKHLEDIIKICNENGVYRIERKEILPYNPGLPF